MFGMTFGMTRGGLVVAPIVALILFATSHRPAYAHMRWFVDQTEHAGAHYPFDLTSLMVVLGVALFAVVTLVFEKSHVYRQITRRWETVSRRVPEGFEWRIVGLCLGILLTVNAVTGVFLAPNLDLFGDNVLLVGGLAQLAVGLLFISQRSFFLGGILLITVVLPLAIAHVPLGLLVDYYVEFLAIGLAMMIWGVRLCPLDGSICRVLRLNFQLLADLPYLLVRIGTGITLIVLALHAKLLDPSLALTFLDENELNFMPLLGFDGFTNVYFALSAGLVELTIGIFLVTGVATRFVTILFCMVLGSTLIMLGPGELIGHLPLFGVAVPLILRGGSGRLHLRESSTAGRIRASSPAAAT